MNTGFKHLSIIYIGMILFLLNLCKNPPPPPPEVNHPETTVDSENVTDNAEVATATVSKPDLSISNFNLTKIANSNAGFTHKLSITIKNSGNAVAKGFDCNLNYNCPAGTVNSGGDNIVQAGYIAANKNYDYVKLIRIQCKPIPGTLNLKLIVDNNNDVEESNENNNTLTRNTLVPF